MTGRASLSARPPPLPCPSISGTTPTYRYKDAYFNVYPGVWRHGDYVEFYSDTKGVTFFGRSDAILKPSGVRIGTAEIYNVVDKFEEIADCVAIGQNWEGDQRVLLFVKLAPGAVLTDELKDADKEHAEGQGVPEARAGPDHRGARYTLHVQHEEGGERDHQHRQRETGDEQGRPGQPGVARLFREGHAGAPKVRQSVFPAAKEERMSESVLNEKNILVVDDEPDVLALVKEEILSAAPKSTVETAATYEEAWERLPHGRTTSSSWT